MQPNHITATIDQFIRNLAVAQPIVELILDYDLTPSELNVFAQFARRAMPENQYIMPTGTVPSRAMRNLINAGLVEDCNGMLLLTSDACRLIGVPFRIPDSYGVDYRADDPLSQLFV